MGKGVKVCKTKTLVAKRGKDWSVYLKCNEGCYQEEIAAQKGEWCEDNADEEEYLNICDGSKTDCVLKGKDWNVYLKCNEGCYQEEIAAQKGEWCEDNADE